MQLPFASLLANLELIRATHPELRTSCTFLQTWLELKAKGRAPADLLPSQLWMDELLKVQELATVKLFTTLPCESHRVPGFALFDDETRFWLTDGVRSVRLALVNGFHPCLSMVGTEIGGQDRVYYLIEGSYWSGQSLPQGVEDLRKIILVTVRDNGQAPYVLPMNRSKLQILREAERVPA